MPNDSYLFDVRGEKKKKFNFGKKKENTIRSLSEIEHFLCQCTKAIKCGKVIKILKN